MSDRDVRYNEQHRAGWSPGLWSQIDHEYLRATREGYHIGDDFTGKIGETALPVEADFYTIDQSDGAATLALVTGVAARSGICRMGITASADNEEGWIRDRLPHVSIDTSGTEMVFETRFRVSSITDDDNGIAIGLVNAISAGDNVFQNVDTAEITTAGVAFVGFSTLLSASDTLRAVYKESGTAPTVLTAVAKTLVADTWYNVGIYFDGKTTVEYYVDGERVGSVSEAATNFPNGVAIGWGMASKVGSAAGANDLDCDWWDVLSVRPTTN